MKSTLLGVAAAGFGIDLWGMLAQAAQAPQSLDLVSIGQTVSTVAVLVWVVIDVRAQRDNLIKLIDTLRSEGVRREDRMHSLLLAVTVATERLADALRDSPLKVDPNALPSARGIIDKMKEDPTPLGRNSP